MNWLSKISQKRSMPSLAVLQALRPQMAQQAQGVYDAWEQDAEGLDPELGGGGICDQIANELSDVVSLHTQFDVQGGGQDGDDHAYILVKTPEGIYSVDIAPGVYETGGGYSWQKIPGVVFSPNDVDIDYLGNDPAYWGEDF